MAPYNFKVDDVIFETDKQIYVVDLDPVNPGLYRQNAMTIYQHITPFLIEASCVESNTKLFYLVYCRHNGWVRVDEDIAKYIINHKSVKPPSSPPQQPVKNYSYKKFLIITPVLLVTSLTFYKKFYKK